MIRPHGTRDVSLRTPNDLLADFISTMHIKPACSRWQTHRCTREPCSELFLFGSGLKSFDYCSCLPTTVRCALTTDHQTKVPKRPRDPYPTNFRSGIVDPCSSPT
eukprot:6592563-Pyramimonas_sp.AAC.1